MRYTKIRYATASPYIETLQVRKILAYADETGVCNSGAEAKIENFECGLISEAPKSRGRQLIARRQFQRFQFKIFNGGERAESHTVNERTTEVQVLQALRLFFYIP